MLNAIALYDCVADEEGELSFTEGTRFVDVVDSTEEDWLEGRIEGTTQRGLFPSNYVNVITVSSTPTVVKSIPKASNHDVNLSHSVSPPNTNMSASWSVIPNNTPTNTTSLPTDINSSNFTSSKSTRLNAFDSAMQTPPSSKYSDIAAALMNMRTTPKPTMNSSNTTTTSKSITATIDANKSPSSRTFVLPTLSPVQQQTRTRSFSASSTTTPSPPPTALKPSALRQDFRNKSQQDTSWRSKLDNGSSQTTTNSTAQRPSLEKTTDIKMNTANSTGNDDDDTEEEDGYQLVKPSQLRKRQQQQQQQQQGKGFGKLSANTAASVNLPLSSSVSTSALPTQKSSTGSKTRLQTLPSSSTTHLAKLPSRPVSNANRLSKSRSSSTRSNSSSSPSKNSDPKNTTIASNGVSAATGSSNKTAPTIKPKPAQLNNLPKASMLTTKERSASNPPPIQPKSFANSDIQRLGKPLFPLPNTSSPAEKNGTTATSKATTPPVGTRTGVALPGLGKKSSAPTLPTRPPTAAVPSSSGSTIDNIFKEKKHVDENTNLKPSQLLTTQRARSSTNPSFATTRPFMEVTNGNGNGTRKLSSVPLDTPTDGAIRSPPPPPPPIASAVASSTTKPPPSSPAIPSVIKQAPPPPPSRQINHNINNNKKESDGRTRYDVLFDSIQDDGYVDGMTVQVIWSRSRLPDDMLAGIWQQCDQQKSGLLDRQRFIHGMRQIDSHLTKNRATVPS